MKTKEKFGYFTMAMATNVVFSFKNVYYMIFLTNVMLIDVAAAGMIVALGTVWDAVNDPLLGLWAANHQFRSGEKVRPLLLRASLPWAAALALLFLRFRAGRTLTILLCLLLYFLFDTCYTLIAIPYASMSSLASPNDDDRKTINALRGFGAGIGSGIGAVAITPLIKLFGGLSGENAVVGPNDAGALFKTAVVMGLICLFGSMIHYFTSAERVKETVSEQKSRISFGSACRYLFGCRSWVMNCAYFLFYNVINILTMTIVSYYASYVLKATSKTTLILAFYMIFYVIMSIVVPYLDKKMGRKKAMLFSLIIQMLPKIPFMICPHSLICILINAAGCGAGGACVFVLAGTNRNRISDILELRSAHRMDSFVSTGENMFLKLSEALVQWLISISLACAGFDALKGAAQPDPAVNVICLGLGLVPFLMCFGSLFIVMKLDVEKEYRTVKEKMAIPGRNNNEEH